MSRPELSRRERGSNGHSAVSVLELSDVSKTYGQEPDKVHALVGVTCRCGPGRWWR
jgi:hypothetical protein